MIEDATSIQIFKKSSSEFIGELTQLHNLLCEVSDSVQRYFGNQIVLIVIVDFFNIVSDSYYALEIVLGKEEYFKTLNEYEVIATIFVEVSVWLALGCV